MKIEKYVLHLNVDKDNDPFQNSPARGALMHGFLMNAVASDELHNSQSRPFSQNIIWHAPGEYLWNINVLHEKANAIKLWLETNPTQIDIQHYGCSFDVLSTELVSSTSYEEMLAEVLVELPPKYASFEFMSPLLFKKAGMKNPWPYPEARMLMQSGLSRWNAFSDAAKFDDESILEEATLHIFPHAFKLNSQRIAMDATNIVGCRGSASFSIQKSELRQLMNLVGRFSEYSGLGAKTAMGLGAVRYSPGLIGKQRKTEAGVIL